jgi:hypothetical protein
VYVSESICGDTPNDICYTIGTKPNPDSEYLIVAGIPSATNQYERWVDTYDILVQSQYQESFGAYIASAAPSKNLTTMNFAKPLHKTLMNISIPHAILKTVSKHGFAIDAGSLILTLQTIYMNLE